MTAETISVEDYAKQQERSVEKFLDSVSIMKWEKLKIPLCRKVWWNDYWTNKDRSGTTKEKVRHYEYAYDYHQRGNTSEQLTLNANLATLRYLKWLEAEQEGEQV